MQKSVEAQMQELADADMIVWNGKKYQPNPKRSRPRLSSDTPKTAAEIVVEGRS